MMKMSVRSRAKKTPDQWTELELCDAMVAGEARGWNEFQRRYDRLIQRCILKVTRRFASVVTHEDVREIAATLSLSLLANDMHKLRSFDPDRGNRFSSWIGLLAINCAYDYLRQIKREPTKASLTEASELACQLPDPFDSVAERERADFAHKMLEEFTPRDRAFAALYFGEGMEPDEIAKRMKISVKTVYSKKHKIQARLEAAVARAA
jgi:RNA polymerase sigma-70 factor (ECF subfamily)